MDEKQWINYMAVDFAELCCPEGLVTQELIDKYEQRIMYLLQEKGKLLEVNLDH